MAWLLGLPAFRTFTRLVSVATVVLFVLGLYLLVQQQNAWGLAPIAVSIALVYLASRVQVRPDEGAARLLVLVTKKACTLCDEAKARLMQETRGTGLRVQEVGIETSRRLARRYKHWVPVLLWQNETIARGVFAWSEVRTRLASISSQAETTVENAP